MKRGDGVEWNESIKSIWKISRTGHWFGRERRIHVSILRV